VEFVLGKWTDSELPIVSRKIQASAEVIESFVVRGLPMAMNEANKLDFSPDIV
jgi:PTH1 family peptidyl-tRNA hydrolase